MTATAGAWRLLLLGVLFGIAAALKLDASRRDSLSGFYVITCDSKDAPLRMRYMMANLAAMQAPAPTVVKGLTASRFHNLHDQIEASNLTQEHRREWLSMGALPIGGDASMKPSGPLDLFLAHREIWQKIQGNAPASGVGRFTVVLEDDALAVRGQTFAGMLATLATVPPEVDMVFLEDRHCQFASIVGLVVGKSMPLFGYGGTAAYAITPRGAKALLSLPMDRPVDHAFSAGIRCGRPQEAYCPPGMPFFMHGYNHNTQMPQFLQYGDLC